MTTKMRSLRNFRNPIGCLILLAAFAAAAGCSTAESPSGSGTNMNHVLPSGSSVSGWLVVPSGGSHASTATLDYIANGGSSGCTQCHGSDLSGGISNVSCFGNPAGCHHDPVANWATPAGHGATAKKAPGSSGFASCQICHGSDFSGGGAKVSCFTCHGVSAPHAPKPWRGSPYTHTTTDNANASVCYGCHAYTGTANPNNPHVPPTPAPAGTAPGCYNGTMCHNQGGHPAGWAATPPADQPHGDAAKKDNTVAGQGFPYCQTCHGANFAGGSVSVSCFICHTVNAPHAPKPWRGLSGSPYTHTDTAEAGNAPVCYQCHAYTGTANPNNPHVPPTPAPAGSAPGCFNGTMCHNQGGHPAGWVATSPAAQPHGDAAKKDNTVAGQGFPYCQTCHGANFAGGSAGVSCFLCHTPPHAPKPWRASAGSTYTHTTTAEAGNAPVCYQCHAYTGTANPNNPHVPPTPAPAGTAPGCFNGTMCHNQGGHPVPYNDNSHYSVTSTTFPGSCSACHDVSAPSTKAGPACQTCHVAASPLSAANCTSCHASPPNGAAPAGAAYANIAGAHAAHLALTSAGTPISCDTCHSGLGPSLQNLNHYNRAKSRVAPGDVAFLATYNAKTGASSFLAGSLTCTNVSCHGGTSPNWQTGAFNVNTACTLCHSQGTTQYNSYNSGEHGINSAHSNCTNCHNTTTLAVNHFTTLSTTAMEGPASATIGGTGTGIPAGNYVVATKSCTPSCHGNETW